MYLMWVTKPISTSPGVRTFCPKPVAKMIMNMGGTSALMGLIAMATDVEGLYAAVKALVCVVRSNTLAVREMDRTKGYQVTDWGTAKRTERRNMRRTNCNIIDNYCWKYKCQ